MQIEIEVYGNPGLYKSLRDGFAAESTRHRTFWGAANRLVQLDRLAKKWAQSCGHWGGIRVKVDGVDLGKSRGPHDAWYLPTVDDAKYRDQDPATYIAASLRERHEEVTADA